MQEALSGKTNKPTNLQTTCNKQQTESQFATVLRLSAYDRCNVAAPTIAYRHQILLDIDSHKRQPRVLLSFLTFDNVCILVIFTLYSFSPIVPGTHIANPIIFLYMFYIYIYIFSTLSPISEVHIYTASRSFLFFIGFLSFNYRRNISPCPHTHRYYYFFYFSRFQLLGLRRQMLVSLSAQFSDIQDIVKYFRYL